MGLPNKRQMKRRRSCAKNNSGVDEGQIIEALRLTPTERWEKHRVFVDLIEEMERATKAKTAK